MENPIQHQTLPKVVYILRGVPGCGKSTLANELSNGKPWLVFEADKYHYVDGEYKWDNKNVKWAHEQTFNSFCEYLEQGIGPLVVSNTNTTVKEYGRYYTEARKHGYQVFTLVVENRHDGENIHSVPEETLKRMENNIRNSLKLR